jgi:DNA modification methylase
MPVDLRANAGNDEGRLAEITWHNEKRAIRDLIPYEVNPRQITNKQAKDLKASLAKFGIADPLIINTDNMIIGGHQRKKILETLLGYEPDYQIDVRVPDRALSIDEARELNVRLNKNVAEWNFDILANNFELDDLLDWGFDKGELDLDLWAGDAPEDVEPQIDKAEELREKWQVQTGQLWQLGEHRLICGDCTDKAVVDRLMGGERADMIFTDPPYGIDLDTDWSKMTGPNTKIVRNINTFNKVIGDDKPFDPTFIFELFGYCDEIFMWGADYYYDKLPKGTFLVWDKRVTEELDRMYGSHFEILWSKNKHRKEIIRYIWAGFLGHNKTLDSDRKVHPTQKPVGLMIEILNKYSKDNWIVVDPFLGSGTTLIACERLGRKCRAVEISPAYCAVSIQRWVDVTGGVPELLSS